MNEAHIEAAIAADPKMDLLIYQESKECELFKEAIEKYYNKLDKVKAKLPVVPLKFLVKRSKTGYNYTKLDPDFIPRRLMTLPDAAGREIHRRAFLAFTIANRKKKIDPCSLGFLRKPNK